ncbi:MAG: hypothetical protein ING75_09260 [Rhodocyclaceae bacterium]|nr:hypothetical protein [Rhodocyclaceae bacterium]
MSKNRFNTSSDAQNAGFVPAKHRTLEKYRGFKIQCVDVSCNNSFGYDFAITVFLSSELDAALFINDVKLPIDHYARSCTLWLADDLNKLRRAGCFAAFFDPNDYRDGLARARASIDRFYATTPDAERLHSEFCMWRAQTDLRQAAKIAARSHRRATQS